MNKITGDIIILHMRTKKPHNHIRYASWDKKWNRQFFVILGHFLSFNPTNDSEN